MMVRRTALLAAACLLLSSCQPPVYDILAFVRGTDIVFEARGAGHWPFRTDDGISANWVQVRDRDHIIWAIGLDPGRPDCKAGGATPPFPLVYGRVPACYREMVHALLPVGGALHRIDGEGFRQGSGLFRLQQDAVNVDWRDVESEIRNWSSLPDPRFPPGPGNGRPEVDDVGKSGENATR